jgi:hypothetical protein
MKTIVALLLLAWLMPVAAATEEWKAYPYPDAGFAIQLPAAPTVEKSTFKTSAGVSLPMTRYVVRQDRSVYTLNIVDYSTTTADAMTTIAEIEKFIGANGGGGGFGGFGGPGGGRFRGGPNPRALAACVGKSAGDAVQLDTPDGPVAATCALIARPNAPPNAPPAGNQ